MTKKRKVQKTAAGTPPAPFVLSPAAKNFFTVLFILAVGLAFFLRFYDLERKPLHHDEGVNSFFLLNLKAGFEKGQAAGQPVDITPSWLKWALPLTKKLDHLTAWSWNNGFNGWKYDPSNYHGPYLFLTHIIPLAIGESAFALRFGVALFGSLLLLLLWPLRRKMGRAAVAATAFFLAVSPTNLFFARTSIHETYLVFFTLGAVAAAVRFRESGRGGYLILLGACLALMITVKETYILTFFAFFASLLFTYFWFSLSRKRDETPPRQALRSLIEQIRANLTYCWIALGLFVFIIVIFYSSVFTNWKGTTVDLINTFLKWTKTGETGEGHQKPFWYFFKLLYKFELPLILLGFLGIVSSFRKRNPLMIFTSVWAVLLFFIYSVITYKTPWLALNFILPLALLSGYFCEQVYRAVSRSRGWTITTAVLFAGMLTAWGRGVSWPVNFVYYDDDSYMLVYSQTRRDLYDLVERLEKYAQTKAQGYETEIKCLSDEYWPLEWYLRDYHHVGFYGKVIDNPDAPIVIGRTTTQDQLEKKLKDTYYSEMYSLRPGLDLILYTRAHRGKTPEEELKGEEALTVTADKKLEPGLVGKYFRKISPVGKPAFTRIESSFAFHYDNDAEKERGAGLKSPFSILWDGIIEIPRAGQYTFATESDDGSWLLIDDKMVVDNGGTHGTQYVSGYIQLTKGYHKIRIKYFDSAWGAIMKVTWITPGGKEEPIPARYLWN